ncbi:MAG: BadF/BadG/BcrA/BcrD ATPase family protein [Lachnospiraceae bacterium]|nr:BadF/BadG/BcrA/BcrD ATPase family protein [Lachnospiraceae bacterium]
MKLWVSVDGGGTKTTICACDEHYKKVFDESFGCSNYKAAGLKTVSEILVNAFEHMMNTLKCTKENIAGVVMAIAGCDTQKDVLVYKNIMKSTKIEEEKLFVCNDTEAIFRSLSDKDGICVVAGTGSIVCAYDKNGLRTRVGGWGSPLSDEGSGYWIGAELLKKVIRWYDGVNEESRPVYKEIEKQYSRSGTELAWVLTSLSVKEVAAVSSFVFQYAKQGDELCKEIIQRATDSLIQQISVICKKMSYKKSFSILMVGGLFNDGDFLQRVKMGITEQFQLQKIEFLRPENSPAEDGLNFAKKLFL